MALGHPEIFAPKKQNQFNVYLKYSGLAIQLVVVIGVFGWAGYKLDQYLELQYPIFMLLFILMAFGGMMYQLYKSINQP